MKRAGLQDPPFAAAHVEVNTMRLELIRQGDGRAILFLHPGMGLAGAGDILERLSAQGEVFAPTHPGFGRSDLPAGIKSVDDIAYCYLDLIEQLDLHDILLVGVSFGAWIALEIAVKSCERLRDLVLISPVGVRIGQREQRDLVDVFSLTDDKFCELAYADPAAGRRDFASMSDEEVFVAARNQESHVYFAFAPYMHSPRLGSKLHRVKVPALVLAGAQDQILAPGYAASLNALLPDSILETVQGAGHFPHIERPAVVCERIADFSGASRAAQPLLRRSV